VNRKEEEEEEEGKEGWLTWLKGRGCRHWFG
jgi:hypothetical protein